jgi:hypothetical protein
VDIHYESYVKRKEQIQQALGTFAKEWLITPQIAQITDHLRVQQFWFRRR